MTKNNICIYYNIRTLLTVLHSKKCDGNKNDKKCAKALKKYLKEKNKKHHKHHKKHHEHDKDKNKKHHGHITNVYNVIGDKLKEAQSNKPTPNPPPTGQGVHADVPYSNLIAQRKSFEKEFEKLQEQKSRFTNLYNRKTGDSMDDTPPETPEADPEVKKEKKKRKGRSDKGKKRGPYKAGDVPMAGSVEDMGMEEAFSESGGGGAGQSELEKHAKKRADRANLEAHLDESYDSGN